VQGTRDFVIERREVRDSAPKRGWRYAEALEEISRQLSPYRTEDRPITGHTVIYKELSVDSLVVMDIVLELEDHFDVSIPINIVAEIQTVDDLAEAILELQAQR
jgi:acyl carrier protein